MLFTVISLLVAAICNPLRVLRSIWPHMAVLAAFSAFVFWNGGVVLGKTYETHLKHTLT